MSGQDSVLATESMAELAENRAENRDELFN